MTEPLTNEEYVQMTGMTCPVCQCMPDKLFYGICERIADMIILPVRCEACTAQWDNVYTLSHYSELELPATEESPLA